jgi:hypothetical protein
MRAFNLGCVAFAFFVSPLAVQAAPLTVSNTNFPAVNCVYETDCLIHVGADSEGNFILPHDDGTAFLQSRTFLGLKPAPAGGKGGYMYRVALEGVKGTSATVNCVTKVEIAFGTIVTEPYPPGSSLKDMFFVSSGGTGTIGVASATQTGAVVTVVFAGGGVCPGQSSDFFGMTSASTTPVVNVAMVYYSLGGGQGVDDRNP